MRHLTLLAGCALAVAGLLAAPVTRAEAAGTITIAPLGTLNSYDGDPVYIQVHATDSTPGVTLAYSADALPSGVTLNQATGVISGHPILGPDVGGLGYSLVLTVSGSDGSTATSNFTWNITNQFIDTPLGAVRSAYPGMCLDDQGNRTTAGNPIQLWNCNGSAGEYVTWNFRSLQVLGQCVNDPGGSYRAGTPLSLAPCSGAGSETVRQFGDQLLFFPSQVSAGCVDAPHAAAGTRLVLATGICPVVPGRTEPTGTRWTMPGAPVVLALDGKCLASPNAMTLATTKAELWTCDGTYNQDWSPQPTDFTTRGLPDYQVITQDQVTCLTVHGGATTAGTTVDWETCATSQSLPASPSQLWTPQNGTLVNVASGKCLDDPGNRTANGTQLDIWGCNGKASQQWSAPPSPVASEIPGYCLAARATSAANGTGITVARCASGQSPVPTQNWTLAGLALRDQGLCLTTAGGRTTTGTVVVLSACTSGNTSQQWAELPGGLLRNARAGKCLAFPGAVAAAGAGLVIKPCSSALAAGQEWHLI